MYDDHFYCGDLNPQEGCGKHQATCWCWNSFDTPKEAVEEGLSVCFGHDDPDSNLCEVCGRDLEGRTKYVVFHMGREQLACANCSDGGED